MNRTENLVKIIVNADDFGPNPEVSRSILDAFEKKIVTSTSVIVNVQSAEQWIEELSRTSLPSGIHLNIFSGSPVSNPSTIASLVGSDGNFRRFSSIADMKAHIDAGELSKEFRAQIIRFKSFGLSPTHIDNHRQEIYFCPRLFCVVLDLAEEFSLPIRMPLACDLDIYGETFASMSGTSIHDLKEYQNSLLLSCDSRYIKRPTAFIPDFILNEEISCESILASVSRINGGIVEICSHPSYGSSRGLRELEILAELKSFMDRKTVPFQHACFRDL